MRYRIRGIDKQFVLNTELSVSLFTLDDHRTKLSIYEFTGDGKKKYIEVISTMSGVIFSQGCYVSLLYYDDEAVEYLKKEIIKAGIEIEEDN